MDQDETGRKAEMYSMAINVALAEAGASLGEPDLAAALAALTHSTAYLVARIPDRNQRREAERQIVEDLGRLIPEEVNARILHERMRK